MQAYLDLLKLILDQGDLRENRTDTNALSIFGHQLRFDLKDSFPLLTTKQLHLDSIIHELLWFIKGETNVSYLRKNKIKIWDNWADEQGELGPIYGYQWRNWGGDQLAATVQSICNNPYSRRHIVSAWNVADLDKMAIPPCHVLFQFYVSQDRLSCHLYQRSADIFLGVPFNIASYALLTLMMAQVCGLKAGEFIHSFGDVHLYINHIDQARTQLKRKPYAMPRMLLNNAITDINDFSIDDFTLCDYRYHPHIAAPVAI